MAGYRGSPPALHPSLRRMREKKVISGKRTSSTTPLQALNLLNSSFALQQAEFLAERLRKDAGEKADTQVCRAFALMFNRAPSPDEIADSTALIAQHGLAAFCRALFNTNEFIRLD